MKELIKKKPRKDEIRIRITFTMFILSRVNFYLFYFSVPDTSRENCTQLKKPECGFGQILKTRTDPAGCQKFICGRFPLKWM